MQAIIRLLSLSLAPAGVQMTLRLVGAVVGGYAFTAVLVALLPVGLSLLGLARSEGVTLSAMLGFVIYLLVLIWAFSVRSLLRLWALLVGSTALMGGLLALIR
jgi:hypothetical protein